MKTIIAPSILSLDFRQMTTQLKRVEIAGAKWLHYDVMDGVFVDNISFGPALLNTIDQVSDLFLDVHLMITRPEKYFDAFIANGADMITIHVECYRDAKTGISAIAALHEKGIKAGITLRPSTPIDTVIPYLKYVDAVLVMSVEPGFGGQKFIVSTIERIARLDEMRRLNHYNFLISVDGGINQETGSKCKKAGADVLVAGSYVFANDIEQAVSSLQ